MARRGQEERSPCAGRMGMMEGWEGRLPEARVTWRAL